jgi:hypothetical protein
MSDQQTQQLVRVATQPSEGQQLEFLQKEYQEAAKAFALGVQAGQDLVRQYLFGNALLAAFFGAAAGFSDKQPSAAEWALVVIPTIGIVASGIVLLVLPHYRRLLNVCRDRCSEIEIRFGGRLFTRIGEISKTTHFGAIFGVGIMLCIMMIFWIAMFLVAIRI